MEIRLLGTGGWMPSDRRATACVYLRDGPDALVLDAGSGFRRLVTDPALVDGVERLSIVLTHFHLDHSAQLISLPGLGAVPARELWAPGRLVAGTSAGDVARRLLGPPFLAGDVADVTGKYLTAIRELERDTEIGRFRVRIRVQPMHTGPSVAVRVGDELAYCTDTAYDEENAEFARGVRVLLHEAFVAADTSEDAAHSAAGEAARIAAAAGVGRLILVHVHPLTANEEELAAFARAHFPATEVGRDGMTV